MQRWGHTAAGTVRFRCGACVITTTRKRKDVSCRNERRGKVGWLSSYTSLSVHAKRIGIHRTTLSRRYGNAPNMPFHIPIKILESYIVLVLDGTRLRYGITVLIAFDVASRQPLSWHFVSGETYTYWLALLIRIPERHRVIGIVSDGQKGLIRAINELFPNARHQRCVAHVIRLSLAWLTKHPQTVAGHELRIIICSLGFVKTPNEVQAFRHACVSWKERHALFLKERSKNPWTGRAWYTHRKLRAVASLVMNALDDLFHYVSDARIPNTTNYVEGGINAPLKELLRRHRGITAAQARLLVSHYLMQRRRKKPTRNAT